MSKLKAAWEKKAKVSQKAFCEKHGLDPWRFNKILNGKERPRLKYALALKNKLGISLDIVFDGYDYDKYKNFK